MARWLVAMALVVSGLAACAPDVPDSAPKPVKPKPAPVRAVPADPVAPGAPVSGSASGDASDLAAEVRKALDLPEPVTQAAPLSSTPSASADLPSGVTDVNSFAMQAGNPLGQTLYARPAAARTEFYKSCARYPSQDAAQSDFLKSGGPQADPNGLDPDGDGYACFWDPAQVRRQAAQAGTTVATN